MITTILAGLIGLLGAALPRIIGLFEAKQNHATELDMLRLSGDYQLKMAEGGWTAKAAEINANAELQTDLANLGASMRPVGIKWVDALNAFVRPFLTLAFFALYATVKWATFVTLSVDHVDVASVVLTMWGADDWAIFVSIICFWFGSRAFNKERTK